MNKFILSLIALLALTFTACKKEEPRTIAPIQVGSPDAQSLELSPQRTLTLLLKGGDGKYTALTTESKYATASISRDTLRVVGHFLGETTLILRSHDQERRLPIRVVAPPFASTEDEVSLYPGDDARTLTLSGGGEKATLQVFDPEEAAIIDWKASTGEVRIQAKSEGDIRLLATSEDGLTKKEIKVKIRCAGSADAFGLYTTTSRSLSMTFKSLLTVRKRGEFVRLSETTNPVTIAKTAPRLLIQENRVLTVRPEIKAPVVGEKREINVSWLSDYTSINREHPLKKEGKYTVYVEEVRDRQVVVRGKGFKLVLPYSK